MLTFVSLLLAVSMPAAAAAYAMGGISWWQQVLPLYGILFLVLLQYTTLALLVSSLALSMDAAMRITYAAVLLLAVPVWARTSFCRAAGAVRAGGRLVAMRVAHSGGDGIGRPWRCRLLGLTGCFPHGGSLRAVRPGFLDPLRRG